MKKKLLIIEDIMSDYDNIMKIINSKKEYLIYNFTNWTEYKEKLNHLFLNNSPLSEEAIKYFNNIINTFNPDYLILDWELSQDSINNMNGEVFYNLLIKYSEFKNLKTIIFSGAKRQEQNNILEFVNNNDNTKAIFKSADNETIHWAKNEDMKNRLENSFRSFSINKEEKNEILGNKKEINLPTIVILTAIKEEYKAVREHLNDIVDADENDTSYEAGIFKYKEREIAKVIIRECGPKNTTASLETERAIQYFKPNAMFFVGIAGSRKSNDFSLGDVIFPTKVYSYEGGKAEKSAFVSRPDIASLTFTLTEKAKKERLKNEWKDLIKIKKEWNMENIKADLGVIASGEQVVEHYDSKIGEILKIYFNDTSAVEMEGFGFAKATNMQGRETRNMEIGIVRGISDIIEQTDDEKKIKTDNRPRDAKEIASATASAFAFWLILKTYDNL